MNERSWELYSQILSQEDIKLKYSDYATTAYFDLNERQVVVPTFNFLDEEVTQFLVSHEVGHARYSDYSLSDFNAKTERYGDLFNVLEDAHIENRMKSAFNGLKAIFLSAYEKLHKEDFFEIKDEDLSSLNLVSRLNLFYKLGHIVSVPFDNPTETDFALRMKRLSSKDEVTDLAEEILEYLKDVRESHKEEESFSEEDEENAEGTSSSGGATSKEGEDSLSEELVDETSRSLQRNLDDYGRGRLDAPRERSNPSVTLSTKEAFLNAVDYSVYAKTIRETRYYKSKGCKKLVEQVKALAKSADSVFQRRKQAESLRTMKNRQTGRINPKKLSKHRLTNNIFDNVKLLKEGKNHGIVVVVDYSGSMDEYLRDTLMQACVLGEFCRMNDIPFVVIAFGVRGTDIPSTKKVMILGNNGFFDIGCILFLEEKTQFIHNKQLCYFTRGSTPTVDALLVATYYIEAFKGLGVDKTALFLITDGYHTKEYYKDGVDNWLGDRCSSVVVDNVLYDVKDAIRSSIRRPHTDWIVELLCLNIRKRFNSFVSISHLSSFDGIRTLFSEDVYQAFPALRPASYSYAYDYADNYIFLWKHALYFERDFSKIPCSLSKDGIVSHDFKDNPFVNHFQFLDQGKEWASDGLTNYLKWYKRIKVFVNAFVERFS